MQYQSIHFIYHYIYYKYFIASERNGISCKNSFRLMLSINGNLFYSVRQVCICVGVCIIRSLITDWSFIYIFCTISLCTVSLCTKCMKCTISLCTFVLCTMSLCTKSLGTISLCTFSLYTFVYSHEKINDSVLQTINLNILYNKLTIRLLYI